jgi:RNA polymerase sigma-70 factor, ECF subfamily
MPWLSPPPSPDPAVAKEERTIADLPLKNGGAGEYAGGVDALATELMTATKHGDREAFDRLTLTLRGRAFTIARSLVGSREDALDLTQEAFMKTYRARDTYREGEPFLPWFHRILRNTCFSFLRKNRRIRTNTVTSEEDGEATDWQIEGDEPAPSSRLERGEVREAFWAGFRQLGARDREILALRHFQDLSYREIADALDIPQGTVMSRLFHARRRLREALASHLEGALDEYPPPLPSRDEHDGGTA